MKLTPEQAALKAKGDEAYRKRQEALAKMAKENQQRQADQLKEPKP